MAFDPKPQEIYRHFKGNLYQIVTLAEHSESGEVLVIYQALYGNFKVYARPLSMFTGLVDKQKYPDAKQEYRFERVTDDADIQKAPVSPKTQESQEISETSKTEKKETPSEEPQLDPMLVKFMDAETYEEKLDILNCMHSRITDEMITTMAIVCDVEVAEGELEERYRELRNCLVTLEKYECNRLR